MSEAIETPPSPGEPAAGDVYAKIVNGIRDYAIFSLDRAGTIATWTRGAEALSGYTGAEAVGQPYSIFGAQDSGTDCARMLELASSDGSFQQERWWRQRDGGLVWVDEVISTLDDASFVVLVRNLTERMEAEERRTEGEAREEEGLGRERVLRSELQMAERRAAFLAEASSILVATSLDWDATLRALVRLGVSRLGDWCAIHAMDENRELTTAAVAHRNPKLEEATRAAVDTSLNERWEQTVRSVISTGQGQILEARAAAQWFGDRDETGVAEIGYGSAMVTPLMGRGEVLGAITLVNGDDHEYDEEDLALAEELGRRAAMALDNARLYRDAQEANRAKADFLAVMSHELRTPLNAIMGYSDLLDAEISGELSGKQRRQIERIRASARHLLQLIEEILSYARMEAGGEEVRLAIVDAHELADEAAAVIEPMAAARGLDFSVEVEEPTKLETDPGKVRQVLVNLLSNAVKFTERGSVTLRCRRDGDDVLFEVIDTGVGIAPEQMKRIFDPFWQVEHPNTRRVGGTGLGLSVSRRYIRLVHGDIEVDSEPGSGTTFRVRLPLRLTGSPGND